MKKNRKQYAKSIFKNRYCYSLIKKLEIGEHIEDNLKTNPVIL
jgi:hypothetical protein